MAKQEEFLEKLEKRYRKFEKFIEYPGRSFISKIKRLLLTPKIYIPYILLRLPLLKNYKFVTKLFWGRKIIFSINDSSSSLLHSSGLLLGEFYLTKFFIKNLKDNDIFYDIGANYGFYTYLSLEFCKEVHSFEPLPTVFKELENNLSTVNKVFLNNVAISNINGLINLYLSVSSDVSTINEEILEITPYKYFDKVKVKAITLDEYINNHSKPTVIKMDAEGAESMIIEGARQFLKNNSPIITMEVWSGENGKNISMRSVEMLRNLGFQSYYIDSQGELQKARGDLSKLPRLYGDNFIFLK